MQGGIVLHEFADLVGDDFPVVSRFLGSRFIEAVGFGAVDDGG